MSYQQPRPRICGDCGQPCTGSGAYADQQATPEGYARVICGLCYRAKYGPDDPVHGHVQYMQDRVCPVCDERIPGTDRERATV